MGILLLESLLTYSGDQQEWTGKITVLLLKENLWQSVKKINMISVTRNNNKVVEHLCSAIKTETYLLKHT